MTRFQFAVLLLVCLGLFKRRRLNNFIRKLLYVLRTHLPSDDGSIAPISACGKYKVVKSLTKSSFGEILLARHPEGGGLVVIKRIHLETKGSRSSGCVSKAFAQIEINIMREMSAGHKNVIDMLDTFSHEDTLEMIALEYCPGGDLLSLLENQADERFSEKEAHGYFVQVGAGVRGRGPGTSTF
jgi:serine/threonine protein kinase